MNIGRTKYTLDCIVADLRSLKTVDLEKVTNCLWDIRFHSGKCDYNTYRSIVDKAMLEIRKPMPKTYEILKQLLLDLEKKVEKLEFLNSIPI